MPTKRIAIQLQPARSRELDVAGAVALLTEVGEQFAVKPRVTEGFDNERYINVDFATTDVIGLSTALLKAVRSTRTLAASAIVCSEGKAGWDDYLLLHHFDPSVPLDNCP